MSAKKQTQKPTTKNKRGVQKKATQNSRSTTNRRKNIKNNSDNKIKISPRVRAILFASAAIIFSILVFVQGQNVWTYIRGFFFGIFGICIVFVPVVLAYIAFLSEKEQIISHLRIKVLLCILIILFLGSIFYIAGGSEFKQFNFFACLGKLYLRDSNIDQYFSFGCGLLGGLLGYPMVVLCGEAVAMCISIIATVAMVFIVANLSINDIAKSATQRVEHFKYISEQRMQERKQRRNKPQTQSEDDYFSEYEKMKNARTDKIDIPLDDTPKKKKKSKKVTTGIDVDVVEDNEQNAKDKDLSEDLLNIINRASKSVMQDSMVEDIAENISEQKQSNHLGNGAKQADPETVVVKKEGNKNEENEFSNIGYNPNKEDDDSDKKIYHYPPIQLLSLPKNTNDRNATEEMHNNAKKLSETLKSFGVNANIVNICRGPSVTRYELQPAPGVKISKITNLSDDIALNLAANGVRLEAPIPGKAAVGIEVPNKVVSMVSMRELIDSEKFKNAKSKLTAVLGRDISGEIVVADLSKMPHLLIAGTTGSGKSVCVNSILMSILYKATPDEVKLLLIDPKMVEFSKYKGIPHLLVPVVSDAKKAAGALNWAVSEMLQRYKLFSEYDCKDMDSYNLLINKNLQYIKTHKPEKNEEGELVQPVMEVNGLPVAKEKMPRVVIAIDELADLMMAAPSEVEDSICRLAQMARAAGMHLILATQRPTVNVITGLIKANVPSRISLKVSSNTDSRTILDTGGGEKLIGKGDMLFAPVGAPKPIRVQGCYASDEEIEGVTAYIKKSYKAQYNADIEEKIKKIAAEEIANGKKKNENNNDIEVDVKMDEAVKFVIESGQASTSMLQRRLKVGYARAGRMIDDMEQMGVVGPHQGSKPREVLITYNDWLERSNIVGSEN